MSTQQPTQQTAVPDAFRTTTDPGTHARIGLDKDGRIHHVAEHENRIVIIKGGEIQRIKSLAAPPDRDKELAIHIASVGDLIGWCEKDYMTQTEFEDLTEGLKTLHDLMEVSS